MSDYENAVFVSYAWGGERENVVNQIDETLQLRGIRIVRDKRALGYKGSIKEFMERIGEGNCIIVVISDKYLRSPNCMFELVEIAENKHFHDRIFPIVLSDANIYDPIKRIEYVKYWEDKREELAEAMKTLDPANLQGIRDDMDQYDRIRDNISSITSILKDMNTLTPEMHQDSEFSNLYDAITKRLTETSGTPSPELSETESQKAEAKKGAPEVPPSIKLPIPKNVMIGIGAILGLVFLIIIGMSVFKPMDDPGSTQTEAPPIIAPTEEVLTPAETSDPSQEETNPPAVEELNGFTVNRVEYAGSGTSQAFVQGLEGVWYDVVVTDTYTESVYTEVDRDASSVYLEDERGYQIQLDINNGVIYIDLNDGNGQLVRNNILNSYITPTGYAASTVRYQNGEFTQANDKTWVEKKFDTNEEFTYKLTQRDEWTIYLLDQSRNMVASLNLKEKQISLNNSKDGTVSYYVITSAENE